MIKFDRKFVFFILLVLFYSNLIAWSVVYKLTQPQSLEVTFFDVGQGDSTFIETPLGHQILIDGGPDTKVLEKLGQEMPFWDRDIDLIVLTHPEHDHLAGLIEVLKKYQVNNILWNGILRDTAEYQEWKRVLEEEKAEIRIARLGQRIISQQAYFDVWHPLESLEGKEVSNSNNSSLVLRLVFGQNCFLFLGDIYKSVEEEIVSDKENSSCQVLKVAHHGSKTSTSEVFLEKTSPQIAVISAGQDNSYGHPHAETLEVLGRYDITVLRTDLQGDIKIVSDGETLNVK